MIYLDSVLKTTPLTVNDKMDINNLASIALSTHQLVVRNKGIASNTPHALPQVDRLLNKPKLLSLFSEADRVHLLKIISGFTASFKIDDAKAVIEWFKVVKEEIGDEVFAYVSNPASYLNTTLSETMHLMQNLIETASHQQEILPILFKFYEQTLTLKDLLHQIDCIKTRVENQKYLEKDLNEVMKAFACTDEGSLVSVPLKAEQLALIKQEYLQIVEIGKELKKGGIELLIATVKEIQLRLKTNAITIQDKLTLLAVCRQAIKIEFEIFPYNTQMLAVLGLLHFPEKMRGRIAQVRTGEGKSTIVTLLAFYHACQGLTVDIVTTSRYLAQRDQEKYEDFFKKFDISTSHICTDEPTAENFKGLIIYGTNYDFEFALMRDKLGQENIRRIQRKGVIVPRPMEIVIVDEVDSLFIDSALDSARISIPSRVKMNWIYQPIADFVTERKERIYSNLIHPFLSQTRLGEKQNLIQALNNILLEYQGGKFKFIVEKMKQKKLEGWSQAAYCAFYQKERNKDYVVKPIKVIKSGRIEYEEKVVIVDRENTGRLKEKSRWQGGIHEFIEIKENLPVEEENLMPASFCHPIFFKHYHTVFGISGTMSNKEEIEFQYQVDTFDVPPHKTNIRKKLEPKFVYSPIEHANALLLEIKEMQKQRRPILILFETIAETEEFFSFLKKHHLFAQVLNERQSQHENFIILKAGAPGMITSATNTAGRGTDIILYPSSLANGGLHLVFTFYPKNDRVEAQGDGRAARQGQPGSCRLILYIDDPSIKNSEALTSLKKNRELKEKQLSITRKERFEIELINHRYLEAFFEQMQAWQKAISDLFLEEITSLLTVRLKEASPSFSPNNASCLDPFALKLHQIFIYQATQAKSPNHSWIPFLNSVQRTLQINIQQDWAEFFYNRLDDLYQKAKTTVPLKGNITNHYQKLIQKRYQSHHLKWEKYLIKPQVGFNQYLSTITGLGALQ